MAGILVGLGLFLVGLLIAGIAASGTFSTVPFGIGVVMAIVGAIVLVVAVSSSSKGPK